MIRNGWTYAQVARGPVPTQPMTTAGLTPIPADGEAFPPLGPPPTPSPAPAATVSESVHAVSLCQWHISFVFVLTILENANTYIVNYLTTNLVRSFVLVVGSPSHPTITTTTAIAGRI